MIDWAPFLKLFFFSLVLKYLVAIHVYEPFNILEKILLTLNVRIFSLINSKIYLMFKKSDANHVGKQFILSVMKY